MVAISFSTSFLHFLGLDFSTTEELGVDNPLLHRDLSGGADKYVLFSGS